MASQTFNCNYCNKLITSDYRIRNKTHFCDRICSANYLVGKPTWNKGTDNRLTLNCSECHVVVKRAKSLIGNNVYCSTSCYHKASRGKKPWNFAGKRSEDYIERRKFRRVLQKLIFERDGYKCQICDSKGDLQVDHIQSWSEFKDLRFDPNNCRTLCINCHYKITYKCSMPKNIKGWGHNFMEARVVK